MKNQFFLKKSVADILKESHEGSNLKKSLSMSNLIALGIGAIVGTGIFVITGTAAAQYAGPSLTISFIISAVCCIMAGLCYAEFASMIPVAGSVYSYSYATLGEIFAWFAGWILILEYVLAVASVSVGWSGYMTSLLHQVNINLPSQISSPTLNYVAGHGWAFSGSILNLPAMFIIFVLTIFLLGGLKQSTLITNIIVIIKLVVILLFIGFGAFYIHTANWHPYIPKNTGSFGNFGISGIGRGAALVFYAYLGFDALSTAAQETKNPQKDLPRSILLSLLICAVLYIAVTLVLTGIVNYKELNVAAPIALAIDKVGPALAWLSPLIKLGAIAGLSSVIMVMILGQSRIYYSISKDGLLPKFFSKVKQSNGVPFNSTCFAAIISAIIAGLFPLDILSELVCIGTLVAFTTVCISIMVLRKTQPTINRPFKTPLVPFVPVLGTIICIYQMLSLPVSSWIRFLVWLIIGFLIYKFYGLKNSKLNK